MKKDPKKDKKNDKDSGGEKPGQLVSQTDLFQKVTRTDIVPEMRTSYLNYAMSVIVARALPDVRDGLKPVHRRILYSMHELGLTNSSKFRKSAMIVGDVLGKYHPHGDTAVYDAMVNLAQNFKTRYPLVFGQGNFGCFTKDTKVKLTDGRNLSFEDLIKEDRQGKKNYTYTVNKKGLIAVALIKKPRLTKKSAEIMKVILDNGEEIRCTLNHRFMLRDGSYKEAKDLKSGTSLMPIYQKISEKTDRLNRDGYILIYQNKNEEWVPAHHLSDNYNLTNKKYSKSSGRVRHHLDFNKLNNDPENIKRMSWEGHWKIHYENATALHQNEDYRNKIAEGRKKFWDNSQIRKEYADRISAKNTLNWQDPAYREKMSQMLSDVNKEYIQKHPEQRQILSKRASKTLKRLWQDPFYKKIFNEKIIQANKKRITNNTGKTKFLTICKKVLADFQNLNPDLYEQNRKKIYPYGMATSWDTGFKKYFGERIDLVFKEINVNHKVSGVEFLNNTEDVYDLTIDETHNFALASGVFVHNSIDGDSAAAYRYTEAKMSKITSEIIKDLEKETVDFVSNFDSTRKEPKVFPSVIPTLLLNGTLGIAVGMATKVPPHNLTEIMDALIYLSDNKDATMEDILKFVKGPDFPTGGIVYNEKDISHASATGRGGVVMRGEAEIVESKSGLAQIIITSVPYQVNKAEMIIKMADLIKDKKIEGIKDIRDESTEDIRVVIDLKSGTYPQKILNALYKYTDMEQTFNYNMLALVDGVPKTLSIKDILEEFLKHRQIIVKRRTQFDLRKAEEREHILLGLKKALDHIDEIIKIIKKSKDVAEASANLIKTFKFSEIQATAILEMKLQKLAGLERKKIEDELDAIQALIKELKSLLASPAKILKVIKDEFLAIKEKYGDERRTRVVKGTAKEINVEDLIPDTESALVLTSGGYVKRTDPSEYRSQKRGGVGVVDLNTKEEDFITIFLTTSSHSDLLFFSDKGKAYQMKMYDVPEGKRATRGKSIMNFLSLGEGERITSVLAMPAETKKTNLSLMMITKMGVVKKVSADSFREVRRSGIIAIKLHDDDELMVSRFIEGGDTVILATNAGQSIRFKESDVREMGRGAAGVIAMRLKKGDVVVGADVIKKEDKDSKFLVMSDNGYGKMTKLKEYKVQKRGGSGIKTAKVTKKTGNIIVGKVITEKEVEIIAISKNAQVIRTDVKEISTLGRQTQGVRIMKLREGDSIASFACL